MWVPQLEIPYWSLQKAGWIEPAEAVRLTVEWWEGWWRLMSKGKKGASAWAFTVHLKELDWLGKPSFQCFSVVAGRWVWRERLWEKQMAWSKQEQQKQLNDCPSLEIKWRRQPKTALQAPGIALFCHNPSLRILRKEMWWKQVKHIILRGKEEQRLKI